MPEDFAPIMLDDEAAEESAAPTWRAWIELFRLPNVFTAAADILLGYLLVHETLAPWWAFTLLVVASGLMYTSGMVLNDVFDVAIDREERPRRPIPSGRVPLGLALHTGGVMLGAGVSLTWAASALLWMPLPGLIGTLLALAIVTYDRILKRTPLAPLVMGACRTVNILLGASTAATTLHPMQLGVACAIGLYIAGVTWFARTEARTSGRLPLALATLVIGCGIALVAWFPNLADLRLDPRQQPVFAVDLGERWYVMWLLLGLLILRRPVLAIVNPSPARVQLAVKECILSLVVLDAVSCFAVRGLFPAAVILALLVPTMALGRWIYST